MPGGELAIRQPWRMALAWLKASGLAGDERLAPVSYPSPAERRLVVQQIEGRINAPLTSSVGRLFDAVASLLGVRQVVSYEAQAAMELEALAEEGVVETYPFSIRGEQIDPAPLLAALLADLQRGESPGRMAARFHRAVARMVVEVCRALRERTGLERVALSGGVWQNMLLLRLTLEGLEEAGFAVLIHRQVPTNDGGLALGQAAVALARTQGAPGAGDLEGR